MNSNQKLGLDYVDLYQPARMDTEIPVEAIMEEMEYSLINRGIENELIETAK